jgi:hypothetical protein
MNLKPQDVLEGPNSTEDGRGQGRAQRRVDFAGGVIQTLTIALVLATITTVLKLNTNVEVMDGQWKAHREAMETLTQGFRIHVNRVEENRERIIKIESRYVEVSELTLVWEQFAEIKGDVIKNSLTINPNMQATLDDISRRLVEIEHNLHQR